MHRLKFKSNDNENDTVKDSAKEVKMKRIHLMKFFSWTVTHISWVTMTFAPVAYGKEAQAMQIENLKRYSQEFGLNKKTTLDEFWQRSKYYVPGYMYSALENYVNQNPNQLMPEMQIKSTKASNGSNVTTLLFSKNGKTETFEIYGDKEKYARYNGIVLTEKELQSPTKLVAKLNVSNPQISKATDKKIDLFNADRLDAQKRPYRDFTGLPRMTKKMWQGLNIQQKASYIVEMRLLNQKANEVKRAYARSRKTSAFDYFEYKNQYQNRIEAAWKFLVGAEADARPAYTGEHCINQGFVAEDVNAYNKNSYNYRTNKQGQPLKVEACNLQTILESPKYKNNQIVQSARQTCQSQGKMPCNPFIYSYSPESGSPYCSTQQSDKSYQVGTTWEGSCDAQSRLGKSKVQVPEDLLKAGLTKEQYLSDPNHQKIREKLSAEQAESYEESMTFIMGMLKAAKNDSLAAKLGNLEWSEDLEKEILSIQAKFEENITDSMALCSSDVKAGKTNEDNFKSACEQLHRRWLFSQKIIDQLKCGGKSGIAPIMKDGKKVCEEVKPPVVISCPERSSEKGSGCICQNVNDKTQVQFAASSPLPEECKAPVEDRTPTPASCEAKYPGANGLDENCDCKDTKTKPTLKSSASSSQPAAGENSAQTGSSSGSSREEYECRSSSNIWPWLIGGGLLAALLIFGRDKDPKPQTCPTGTKGTPPNCVPDVKCPEGSTGTFPNCVANFKCPTGTTGTFPNCIGTATCPTGTTGTYPNCIGTGKCPTGTTGTFPNCVGTATCPAGTTGTPPNCVGTAKCPTGTTGTYPNCFGTATCPTGTTGTYPNCVGVGRCPTGTTGTFPNCFGPVTCQGSQQVVNGSCICPSSCGPGQSQNPISCVCSAPPSEGGSGSPTCAKPPCSGGVPAQN